ncbi:unnamed protein product [Clonostachys solani]|uniref:PUM-HD domain-containing protein n=1 Tax=Clonostachys solani TaxID=160281 RepID=A0A9N9YTX7_9HYPO|nr:unnamed protein product [Clonostachys solani]
MSLRSFSGSSQRHEQDPTNAGDAPQMSTSNVKSSDPAPDVAKKGISPLTTGKLMKHSPSVSDESYPMDKLIAKLSEQQAVLNKQNEALRSGEDDPYNSRVQGHTSSSTPLPITPATDAFSSTAPTTRPASATFEDNRQDTDEILRLKLQLAQAQTKISRLDQELVQTRTGKPGTSPTGEFPSRSYIPTVRESIWASPDDTQSDTSECLPVGPFSRQRAIWNNPRAPPAVANAAQPSAIEPSPGNWFGGRGFQTSFADSAGPYSQTESCNGDRLTPDSDVHGRPPAGRRGNRYEGRINSPHHFNSSYGGAFNGLANQQDAMMGGHIQNTIIPGPHLGPGQVMSPVGIPPYAQQPQQPVGTPLSPFASEFTSKGAWKAEVRETGSEIFGYRADALQEMPSEGPTYLPPTEPLNYRRLLDRNVNCNWKYIVDKIVCNNDQQASIFLQQKLKVGTPEQKYEIVEAIVAQAYPLMVNRFGNFLVQRCFEHGTPEQVIKIAEAIRGNTLNLSMDPFGCHVVQKAFDSVPEDYKAIMVHELLRRIPETVIHRYACHVWQKLFELRWTESPPQIMKYVNEALRGMWHEVALGETGSLVVQNIFENCLEEDKRPCIEEVLANIDIVAHGQFGNWCIQHICEHGGPPDRSRAIDHVIRYAAEYSTDQFASKVVEKCLKIGGTEFLGRYLDRVCEGRRDRTRIPLIDIASDQYGNYLIQWILNNATPQHREMVAAHIRKHMVSLRGSKFGSRVGMLCTNHAVTTRPGPGVGPGINGRMGPGPRFGNGTYR